MSGIFKTIENSIGDRKIFMNFSFILSHIVISSLLVLCLKNSKPFILAMILASMLGFITYDEKNNIPIYLLFLSGFVIYMLEIYVAKTEKEPKHSFYDKIWKIPYFGIIVYYAVIANNTKLFVSS